MVKVIIKKVKGGPGSGNWGHAGRPGTVGGSAPKTAITNTFDIKNGSITTGMATEFAKEYIRLHNAASREYKKAFSIEGARMWVNDDAHPIDISTYDFIADFLTGKSLDVLDMYRIVRPLTVLGSAHKKITVDNQQRINALVDAIHSKYSIQLENLKRSLFDDMA